MNPAHALAPERAAKIEIEALERLKFSIEEAAKDDPELLLDMAEGETNILDVIDAMLEGDLVDTGLDLGLKHAEEIISVRKERLKKRIATRRALLEQALMLLERDKLERPTATVTLAKRKPVVEVVDESLVPSWFFVPGPPKLDKKALTAEMETRREQPESEPIPGVQWTNGTISLTVRRR